MGVLATASAPIWPSIVSAIAAVAGLGVALGIAFRASSYKQLLDDIHDLLETSNAHTTAAVIRGIRDLLDRRRPSRGGGRRSYDDDQDDEDG